MAKRETKRKNQKITFDYNTESKLIKISLPLTCPTGKVRVRKRKSNTEYGYQVYRKDKKDSSCYIDWQIEYDTTKKEESHSKKWFVRGSGKERKYFYSLSDFISFFYKLEIITKEQLIQIQSDLSEKDKKVFISSNEKLKPIQIRGSLDCESIDISDFTIKPFSTVFPTYLISLPNNIDVEISIFEGGVATSSLMPHLYVCIPFNHLSNFNQLNGRPSEQNATGTFIIDSNNISTFLDIFHILGLLKDTHRDDVVEIINKIFTSK